MQHTKAELGGRTKFEPQCAEQGGKSKWAGFSGIGETARLGEGRSSWNQLGCLVQVKRRLCSEPWSRSQAKVGHLLAPQELQPTLFLIIHLAKRLS